MLEPPHGAWVAETTVDVRSYELDSFAHVNHAVFLNYLEYARFDTLRQGGFPYQEIIARGWGVYVVRIEIDDRERANLDFVTASQCAQGAAENNDKQQGQQKKLDYLTALLEQDLKIFEGNTQ